jgi:hypothetical protein
VYRNYKDFFSIVLMALVEADYKFLWIDVGSDGPATMPVSTMGQNSRKTWRIRTTYSISLPGP